MHHPQRRLQLTMLLLLLHLHIPADTKERCRIKAIKCIKDTMVWDWGRNMAAAT
jgi:hypothetical protein